MIRLTLVLMTATLLASGCTDRTAENQEGGEGGSCYPNNTCNAGLKCMSGLCVKPSSSPDGSTKDTVATGDSMTGNFSFFVTSLETMRKLSGSQNGFGGNLGGLTGADQICQKMAASVGAGSKTWKAFLSVTKGPSGAPVNAIDRIGKGPWYDRNGRLVAKDIAGLTQQRPAADAQIANDLPNEHGQSQKQFGDNHDVLTGSNDQGKLNSTNLKSTCDDWTSAVGPGYSKVVMAGHSWPSTKSPGWIRAHTVPGCAPGVNLKQTGNGAGTDHVGGAGGYGGIYCFALTP